MNALTQERLDYLEAEESTLIDEIEPETRENAYREASAQCLKILYRVIGYIKAARTDREQLLRVDVAAWYFCYPSIAELNLTELASMHGLHRATLSAQALTLERECGGLTPQMGQKLTDARKIFQSKAKENRKKK
jgi:hypothetical protein